MPVQATRGKSRRATRHSGGFRSDLASAVPEDDIEEDGEGIDYLLAKTFSVSSQMRS